MVDPLQPNPPGAQRIHPPTFDADGPPATERQQKPLVVPFPPTTKPEDIGAHKPEGSLSRPAPLTSPLTSIDELRGVCSADLAALFDKGKAPDPAAFTGKMRGLALAAPHHDDTWLGSLIRGMTRMGLLPWAGKISLAAPESDTGSPGTGKNRILGMLLCPFQYDLMSSKLDAGAKVIRLDYHTPRSLLNKVTGIRCVHDEIRDVGNGTFLGMAGLTYQGPVSAALFNGLLRLAGRKERVVPGGPVVPLIYFALQGQPPASRPAPVPR